MNTRAQRASQPAWRGAASTRGSGLGCRLQWQALLILKGVPHPVTADRKEGVGGGVVSTDCSGSAGSSRCVSLQPAPARVWNSLRGRTVALYVCGRLVWPGNYSRKKNSSRFKIRCFPLPNPSPTQKRETKTKQSIVNILFHKILSFCFKN